MDPTFNHIKINFQLFLHEWKLSSELIDHYIREKVINEHYILNYSASYVNQDNNTYIFLLQ